MQILIRKFWSVNVRPRTLGDKMLLPYCQNSTIPKVQGLLPSSTKLFGSDLILKSVRGLYSSFTQSLRVGQDGLKS